VYFLTSQREDKFKWCLKLIEKAIALGFFNLTGKSDFFIKLSLRLS